MTDLIAVAFTRLRHTVAGTSIHSLRLLVEGCVSENSNVGNLVRRGKDGLRSERSEVFLEVSSHDVVSVLIIVATDHHRQSLPSVIISLSY